MFNRFFYQPLHIAPLVVFRILFGLAMFISTARFLLLGWVEDQYLKPLFHFSYYGFEWVKILPPFGMYGLYFLMLISSLGIMLGLFYRLSAIVYFLAFTYIELIDKTYYLNHYYFVSLVAFLLCFVPANGMYSVDAKRKPTIHQEFLPAWCIYIFKFQLGCVYFFAGIFKINSEWLLNAMPLRLWLPAHDDMPIFGFLLKELWVAYVFSWVGMLYDICIPFLLLYRKTRLPAYFILIFFHSITGYFFQIGVFPLVMSMCTLIFFDSNKYFVGSKNQETQSLNIQNSTLNYSPNSSFKIFLISTYIIIQLTLPFRYLLYPGNLFWTEEGYRFSWRVMLVEKAGYANFRIRDNTTGNEFDVINRQFLNTHQEKQMAFQPDMILQFAHFLGHYYQQQGFKNISVFCDSYVTMNGAASKPIINSEVDLLKEKENFSPKTWITTW